MNRLCTLALGLAACGAPPPAPSNPDEGPESGAAGVWAGDAPLAPGPETDHFVLTGGTVVGLGAVDIEIDGGRIVAIGEDVGDGAEPVDIAGRYVAPAFIDSHVHLAYRFSAPELAAGGVAAAVDLAAPLAFVADDHAPLQLQAAGPMLTARGGYPTQSWGRDGYGLEVAGADEAADAVDALIAAGARLVKIPLGAGPDLSDAAIRRAVERAHSNGLYAVTHALTDADASRAAALDFDALAHTPVEPLRDETIAAWSDRAVISTLAAFGGTAAAVDNLRRLRAAGATILYGTDLGNTATPAIDASEIALLSEAGLDGQAVVRAATTTPAQYWGFDAVGSVTEGSRASLLILAIDPYEDPSVLSRPVAVFIDGVKQPRDLVGQLPVGG